MSCNVSIPCDAHWVGADSCLSGSSSSSSSGGSGGSSGGSGGTYNAITITNSTFTGGTITGATASGLSVSSSSWSGGTISSATWTGGTIADTTISTALIVGPTITSPTVTSGTFTTPTLSTPTINNGVLTGGTITGATISGLSLPTASSDAATKGYVDSLAGSGLQIKDPVRVATASNVTLSGGAPNTVDGVTLVLNDRILVKSQSTASQNGIYKVTTVGSGSNGTWARTTDADASAELELAYVLVQEGMALGGNSYVQTATPVTLGVTSLAWTVYYSLTSVAASKITGLITAAQIQSITAGQITGTISAGQIGSVSAASITGSITSGQIGSVNASVISGTITSSQIGSVNAGTINGTITAGQISSLTAGQITGVIVTSQLADQILNTQRLLANDISVVRRVSSLPTLPNSDYPIGCLALNTTNKTLYQNVSNSWTAVTASSNIVGTLTSTDISSVSASSITGLIISSQIGSVAASSITGSITSSQITSLAADKISGSITSSQIGSVAASTITGSITSSQISSVNASAISGTISSTQIASVNANTITLGSLSAINYTVGSGYNTTQITSSGLSACNGQIVLGSNVGNTGGQIRLGSGASRYGLITAIADTLCTIGLFNASGQNSVSLDSGGTGYFKSTITTDNDVVLNGGVLRKQTGNDWTPALHHSNSGGGNTHNIEFQWTGSELNARIDGALTIQLYP